MNGNNSRKDEHIDKIARPLSNDKYNSNDEYYQIKHREN